MDRGEKPRLVLPQRGRVSAAHLQPPVWCIVVWPESPAASQLARSTAGQQAEVGVKQ